VSFTGTLFVTQKGENSLLAQSFVMATKSLLPLPEKYHGLEDEDEIRRKRYLEMITDQDAYIRMRLRSKIVTYIRKFFDTRDFIEIETPILQSQAGGAMAKTFNTYHNDYKIDMVLRIALELEHKIIMTGGFPRVYEIGKNFRNEGSDPTHIQEFTMIEWYAAYQTLDQNMQWTEELLKSIATDVVGNTTFTVYDKDGIGQEVSFTGSWPKIRFPDLLKQNADLDMVVASIDDIKACAKKFGMDDKEIHITGRGNLLDFIFKKSSRINIIEPTFVMDYPSELKPLAQQNFDGTAKVYQLIIGGAEICNAYAELVDPIIQRNLLEDQAVAKEGGDEEAMCVDERFLTAMEHGMPPMTGFGMGIDRLVAILTNQKNLRDTIFFPIMRPRE
jgi:lysyl-tRNA synthetase class 2